MLLHFWNSSKPKYNVYVLNKIQHVICMSISDLLVENSIRSDGQLKTCVVLLIISAIKKSVYFTYEIFMKFEYLWYYAYILYSI